MKKIILLLLSILLLSSCSKKTFELDEKYYFNEGLIEITSLEEVQQKVDNQESFAIFVYMPGCSSCAAFKPVLNSFLKMNEMTFYEISAEVIGSDKENSIMKAIEYAPSVLLYSKGKVVASLDAMSDDDLPYYKTVDSFTSWFLKYCTIKVS